MLAIIHRGIEGGKELRQSSLRGSHSHVATTDHHPGQGRRKESVSCGSFGDNSVGQAGEVHICQHSNIQRRERVTTTRIIGKRRCIRMESLRHGRNRLDAGLSQTEHYYLNKAGHPDHQQIIQTGVDNLLRVGFIKEVKYLEWLAKWWSSERSAVNGEYAWTTQTSRKHA